MFKLTGVLKKEEIRHFTRKDGSEGSNKLLFIEPQGSIYPIKVNVSDPEKRIGKEGEVVTVEVAVFPYYFTKEEDGKTKRQKAYVDFFIPKEK
jgi:hypothetical protein